MSPDHRRLLDPSFERVAVALDSADIVLAERLVNDRLRSPTLAHVRLQQVGSVLDREAAYDAIKQLHDSCGEAMRAHAQRYSRLQWLWYSRRIPSKFVAGNIATTEGSVRALFETACALWAPVDVRFDVDSDTGGIAFAFDDRVALDVLVMVAFARRLHSLQATFRWVGKGAPIEFVAETRPAARPGAALVAAVELYDQRVTHELPQFTRLGTVMSSATGGPLEFMPIGSLWRMPTPEWSTLRHDPFTGERTEILARYSFAGVYFAGVLAMLDGDRLDNDPVWSPIIGSLVIVLTIGYIMHLLRSTDADSSLGTGYTLVRRLELVEIVAKVSASINSSLETAGLRVRVPARFEDFWRDVQSPCKLWPLRPAPIVLETAQGFLLDFANATQRLYTELEYPQTAGDVANYRSRHFELSIQSGVDSSEWRPPPTWQALRGRTLKLDGDALTDIDAVGHRDGTILLISCKSVRYSGEYDSGDWRSVRNAASHIVESVQELRNKIAILKDRWTDITPTLPPYERLVGVVCTPHVFFTPLGIATEFVLPGLRCAASASELQRWIHDIAPG